MVIVSSPRALSKRRVFNVKISEINIKANLLVLKKY